MSGEQQLDVCHYNQWQHHMVNTYEVDAVWCNLQVKLCDPYLSTLSVRCYNKGAIYTYLLIIYIHGSNQLKLYCTVHKTHEASPDKFHRDVPRRQKSSRAACEAAAEQRETPTVSRRTLAGQRRADKLSKQFDNNQLIHKCLIYSPCIVTLHIIYVSLDLRYLSIIHHPLQYVCLLYKSVTVSVFKGILTHLIT